MPDTKKYLDVDGLTEYHESAGHSADIADGSITTEKLAPMAVTASKLADKSITATKLASKAVDSYSLADYAVTTAKLDTSAVTNDKLAPEAVTGSKIHPDSVNNTHIASGAIQGYNIKDAAVTYSKIDLAAISIIQAASLIAADSQADQALTALHMAHRTLTPEEIAVNNEYANTTNRLCWISGTFLEVAPISFFGDLQSGPITVYASGMHSTASGKLGIDASWTIASN